MTRTRLSSKGQVVIPKEMRKRHGWTPGTELEVVAVNDTVLLRPVRIFPPTTVDRVFGCLRYEGRPLTVQQMDAAVAREARRRR